MNLNAFFKNEERFEDLDASLNSIFDNGLLVEVNSVLGGNASMTTYAPPLYRPFLVEKIQAGDKVFIERYGKRYCAFLQDSTCVLNTTWFNSARALVSFLKDAGIDEKVDFSGVDALLEEAQASL